MEQRHSTSQSSTCDVYRSLKEISAITFHEIKFSGNIELMDKAYKDGKLYEPIDLRYLDDAWWKLYDEYFEKSDEPSFSKGIRTRKDSIDLLLEINLIQWVMSVLVDMRENMDHVPNEAFMPTIVSLGNSLKKLNRKIKFDSSLPLEENIISLSNVLGGLQTRHRLKFRESLNVTEVEEGEFYIMKIRIEKVLGVSHIPDHINMLQYLFYVKEFKRQVKRNEQQHQRGETSRRSR